MSVADHILMWLVIACAIPVNGYAIFYLFRPWRSTPQGKALMVKAWGNMLVIDVILAYQVFGDYPGRDLVRIVGFGLFCIGVWYLFVTLLTAPNARAYPPFTWLRLATRRGR